MCVEKAALFLMPVPHPEKSQQLMKGRNCLVSSWLVGRMFGPAEVQAKERKLFHLKYDLKA